MSIQSPSLTPAKEQIHSKNMYEESKPIPRSAATSTRQRDPDSLDEDSPCKRQKCLSPDLTIDSTEGPSIDDKENANSCGNTSGVVDLTNVLGEVTELNILDQGKDINEPTKEALKETERLRKQKEKLAQKQERERRKEEEKREREAKKELERKERERKKEEERLAKEQKKEEERLERERKKEKERVERERKKELERLEREKKKEEERLEREQKKEEERIAKEKKREEERIERERKKEEERIKKEEERLKAEAEKAKGQKKIFSFFTANPKKTSSKDVSILSDVSGEKSLYETFFLPFFQKRTVTMHKNGQLSAERLETSKDAFEKALKDGPSGSLEFLLRSNKTSQMSDVSTSPDDVVSALNSPETTEQDIIRLLQNIPPIKYLHFYENTRPPYIGTWCSNDHKRLRFPVLEPFNTSKTGFDYAYDSGLDWDGDEEEEGDDLDEEDMDEDEEMEEVEEEDMNDFVDDDSKRRKKIVGILTPVCQWHTSTEKTGLEELKYEMLINVEMSIDPFHNYFESSTHADKVGINETSAPQASAVAATAASTASPRSLTGTKPKITDDKIIHQLIGFIEENIKFSIGTLTELAKSKEAFSHFTKAILKHTIQDIATYNKSSSNWEVKSELKEKLSSIYG